MNVRIPLSRLREKLEAGKCVTGTAIYSCSPNMVEAAAQSGVDFIRIDSEHAWRRDDSMDNMIRAALLAGAVPIVRIDRDDPYLARKAFEIGAGGVVVSNVTSADYTRRIVDEARFPPLGRRGVGTLCLSAGWGKMPEHEWIAWSNASLLLGVMIESREAVAEIDDIMAVDGIDFALFGPADFGLSLGETEPEAIARLTADAVQHVARSARRAGKHFMLGVGLDDGNIHKAVAMGVTMLEFSHDVVMVRTALERKVAAFGAMGMAVAP